MNNPLYWGANSMSLRRLMLIGSAGGALHPYTLTGNPISFSTNVAKPLAKALVAFSPVQSGSGDPSPENICPITGWDGCNANRTGKNLLQNRGTTTTVNDVEFTVNEDGSIKIHGTASANARFNISHNVDSILAGTYTLSGGKSANVYITLLTSSGSFPVSGGVIDTGSNKTFTLTEPLKNYSCRLMVLSGESVDTTIYPQIELGSTATDYTPYSGNTYSVVFPALGKNLWNPSSPDAKDGYYDMQGTWHSGGGYKCLSFDCAEGDKFVKSGDGWGGVVTFWNGDTFVSSVNSSSVTVPAGANNTRFACASSSTNAQLEKGSTATAYEPYTNTAYAGEIDISTGQLTVNMAFIHLDSSKGWLKGGSSTSAGFNRFYHSPTPAMKYGSAQQGYCDKLPVSIYTSTVQCVVLGYGNATINVLSNSADVDAFKAELTAMGGLDVVYPLATPLVFQLTPQEIKSLIGDNVIWSDTNEDMTITYLKKG